MRIAIIGAGFTGLSAGYYLLKQGHSITIFEQQNFIGGLGAGMKKAMPDFPIEWEWDLEQFYHHWFTNDESVFKLGRALNLSHKFISRRVQTAIWHQDQSYPFDSPINLLTFPHLAWLEKLKTGLTLAQLKYIYREKNSSQFESITAHQYLRQKMGARAYQILWEPLLKGKFGQYYQTINMRWFWARIYKRTPALVYFQGGFSALAEEIAQAISKMDGQIHLQTEIKQITPLAESRLQLQVQNSNLNQDTSASTFDRVIVTTPPFTLNQLIPGLPSSYQKQLRKAQGLGAVVLTLALHHPFLLDTYWLNINDPEFPFLAVVEHTNLADKSHYNNEYIVYIGNYLEPNHPFMRASANELLDTFTPFLKRINPLFSHESIIRQFVFQTPYAQPIVGLNHQAQILPLTTPVPNVYLTSMAQVYPWDRGTNYAIEMGKKIALLVGA